MKIVRSQSRPLVPAGHEDPTDPGVLKRVLLDTGDIPPGNIRMVNWAVLAPGRYFNTHVHVDMTEIFVIVQGSAHMDVDDYGLEVEAEDMIIVEPGERHTMRNNSSWELRFMVIGIVPNSATVTP